MPVFNGVAAQPAIATPLQAVTGPATLIRVIVQATGAGLSHFYDNTDSTGVPIFSTPASPAVGTVYQLDIPCSVGLRIDVAALGPQLTVVYSSN